MKAKQKASQCSNKHKTNISLKHIIVIKSRFILDIFRYNKSHTRGRNKTNLSPTEKSLKIPKTLLSRYRKLNKRIKFQLEFVGFLSQFCSPQHFMPSTENLRIHNKTLRHSFALNLENFLNRMFFLSKEGKKQKQTTYKCKKKGFCNEKHELRLTRRIKNDQGKIQ